MLRRGEQLDIPYMLGVTAQDFMPVVLYPVARRWAKRAARQGRAPCYCYLFGRTPPGDGFRAWHAADLWYMFGGMERSWRKFEERDFKLHELMADYVAGFVKTGNPNEEGLPRWEPISRKQKGFRLLDGESEGYAAPGCCRKEAWRTMLKDPDRCIIKPPSELKLRTGVLYSSFSSSERSFSRAFFSMRET